jgi:hypothetical protein
MINLIDEPPKPSAVVVCVVVVPPLLPEFPATPPVALAGISTGALLEQLSIENPHAIEVRSRTGVIFGLFAFNRTTMSAVGFTVDAD